MFDDAGSLLAEVDKLISLIETGSELRGSSPGDHGCKVCGLGTYASIDSASIGVSLWLSPFICNSCGNIELFQRWEIQARQPQHWKRDDAGMITGQMQGEVLHRRELPRSCTLEFKATLVEPGGSNEIDLIFCGRKVLFFNKGFRVDSWPVQREQGDVIARPGPELKRTYSIQVRKNGEQCQYFIDGEEILRFSISDAREVTQRFGFGVFQNRVEFGEIRLDGKEVT